MTIADVYQSHKLEGQTGKIARDLLDQTHWFTTNAEFDPKTGAALPQALSAFLAKVSEPKPDGNKQDRLYQITEHARCAMERLLRTLNESPRREHALLPVRAVRELDASSFMKLSTRPGRNIREKLAGKPYLQAVRRYQSVDLAENRLLKAYACRLADLLELRREYLNEEEDPLLPIIRSWLRSDTAKAIGRWENLPPNNTLLSHRDYRRVWDSWRRLQTLDSDIAHDLSRIDERRETVRRWNEYALKYREGTHLFADMPVLFDYEKFTIHPWVQAEPLIREAPRRISRSHEKKRVTEPACIDLTELRPRFAVSSKGSQVLDETYLWQQWADEKTSVVISLFDSDAAFLHPASTSIVSADIFFSSDGSDEHRKRLDRAGHTFAARLRETFYDNTLIWLVPEFLNDFELSIIRRNLNAQFPNAEPLPRSVAAVFEQVDYSRIRRDGYTIVVVDTAGGITTATKLIARFDGDLKKRVPETMGYYWEHCPHIILSRQEAGEPSVKGSHYDMITVDGNGDWHNGARTDLAPSIDAQSIKNDQRVGDFHYCITISESPVAGGIKLHDLQAHAGDVPLWREQIPELSIKGYVNGFWGRFYLVDKYTAVPPIRGASISININATFPLSAGKRDYSFPLFRGDNKSALGFEAHLKSTAAFPLKSATVCKLHLTYTYGDDEPYTLIVEPLDGSFPAVRATWRRPEDKIITDAQAPKYPSLLSWEDLRHWHDAGGNEVDLLKWLIHRFKKLLKTSRGNRDQASDENEQRTYYDISRRSFVNRMGIIWSDGRALDNATDHEWAKQVRSNIQAVYAMREKSNRIERCVWLMLSCLHRDAPRDCIEWVISQVEGGRIRDHRAVGFALGDASQEWQQAIFDRLTAIPDNDAISVFAYAIWHDRHFVGLFSIGALKALLKTLLKRLDNICSVSAVKLGKTGKTKAWGLATSESLELLLGLLRTRDSDDPDIKMLLQPHQKITKQFAEQIDHIEDIIAESGITLLSRVQIPTDEKPEGIRTPDLLYALRFYLTGGDGAKAIQITISDTDDD